MKNIQILIALLILSFYSCENSYFDYYASEESSAGTAGSLARFTISANHLYTVDHNSLKIYNIENDSKPEYVDNIFIGLGIETIFTKGNLLLLGSIDGVHIYDISAPSSPQKLSVYSHIRSCDPVVVSGNYAYSTLRTGSTCNSGVNELHVLDISTPANPTQVKTLSMEQPKGLGVSNNLLFVCDQGIKIYNISDKANPVFLNLEDIEANDVIPLDTLLLVASDNGLLEYSFTSEGELTYLSKLY